MALEATMTKIFLGICLVFFVPAPMLAQRADDQAMIKSMRACLKPWLDALDSIHVRSRGDNAVMAAKSNLANGMLLVPTEEKGKKMLRPLTSPKNKDSLGVTPLCSLENLPQPWAKYFSSHPRFLAEYDTSAKTIVLRSDIGAPILVRGLTLMHEIRHAEQWRTLPRADVCVLEVDAYEYQFDLMDGLHLLGYDSLIREEVNRIKVESGTMRGPRPHFDNPKLLLAFGVREATWDQRTSMAMLIYTRARFRIIDQDYPKDALRRKMAFIFSEAGSCR